MFLKMNTIQVQQSIVPTMSSLMELYYKSIEIMDCDTLAYLKNDAEREWRNKIYYELLNKIKANYNLRDPIIIQILAYINLNYRLAKIKNQLPNTTITIDYSDMFENSLGNILSLLDEVDMLDDKTIFSYFNIMQTYKEDPAKEMLEEIYNLYFCKHLDDLQSILEFYKMLKSKGIPDSDFIEIFSQNLFNKMLKYQEQCVIRKRSEQFETEQQIKKHKY